MPLTLRSIRRTITLVVLGAGAVALAAYAPMRPTMSAGSFPAEIPGLYRIDYVGSAASSITFVRFYANGRARIEGLRLRLDDHVRATSLVAPPRAMLLWSVRQPSATGRLGAIARDVVPPRLCTRLGTREQCERLDRDPLTGDLTLYGGLFPGSGGREHLVRVRE